MYMYCRRNSAAEEAAKQFQPHHVFIYAPYEKAINLVFPAALNISSNT
jgi:hypothetical protein